MFHGLMYSQSGIVFINNNLELALQQAKEENKDIFIDTYAPWCIPCKQMDKVFLDKDLSNSFNKKFINVKIDVDSPSGKTIAKNYEVIFLPTMLILNKDGYVKHRIDGLTSAEDLISIGEFVDNPIDYKLEKDHLAGKNNGNILSNQNINASDIKEEKVLYVLGSKESDINPHFLYEEAFFRINLMDGSEFEVAERYLATQSDWSSEKNMNFIISFLHNVDSAMFDYYIKEKVAFQKLIGPSQYHQVLEILINKSLYQQIPRPSLKKAAQLLKILHVVDADQFIEKYNQERVNNN